MKQSRTDTLITDRTTPSRCACHPSPEGNFYNVRDAEGVVPYNRITGGVCEVAVIGLGPAGAFAAIAAAREGAAVTVFEKNEKTGKKLYITGKGRANITNDWHIILDEIKNNRPPILFYMNTPKDKKSGHFAVIGELKLTRDGWSKQVHDAYCTIVMGWGRNNLIRFVRETIEALNRQH